uniref:Uncharacterized protein n=1 Tax=Globodera rostochiensis TaxID=31243 RepID=A0A914HFA8_GLORO
MFKLFFILVISSFDFIDGQPLKENEKNVTQPVSGQSDGATLSTKVAESSISNNPDENVLVCPNCNFVLKPEQLKIQPKAKQSQPKSHERHAFHVTDDVQVDLPNEEDDDLTMSRKLRNEMIGREENHYRPDIFY